MGALKDKTLRSTYPPIEGLGPVIQFSHCGVEDVLSLEYESTPECCHVHNSLTRILDPTVQYYEIASSRQDYAIG